MGVRNLGMADYGIFEEYMLGDCQRLSAICECLHDAGLVANVLCLCVARLVVGIEGSFLQSISIAPVWPDRPMFSDHECANEFPPTGEQFGVGPLQLAEFQLKNVPDGACLLVFYCQWCVFCFSVLWTTHANQHNAHTHCCFVPPLLFLFFFISYQAWC